MTRTMWLLRIECPHCGSMKGIQHNPALIEECTACGNAVMYPWSG